MLCCNCKKNLATKTYEQIKRGKKEEEQYCQECYDRLFICAKNTSTGGATSCPYCGSTVEEIKKKKLVGCAHCYRMLDATLVPMLIKMQGGARIHNGKTPVGGAKERLERRLYELQTIVDKLVAEGDFKSAKTYADELSRLKGGLDEREGFVWRNLLNS